MHHRLIVSRDLPFVTARIALESDRACVAPYFDATSEPVTDTAFRAAGESSELIKVEPQSCTVRRREAIRIDP